ncbi:mitochondrial ribosomal subunit S27-domain-containing protein [Lasiosphaeria miniovina]|uniref:Small ribosomal subunit protein mS33 n=2 Tax=Lasiosphaeria TaxID=92901 RepID=A0AA39ZZL1_9PEZI|nr:mitochondrial ribosomal subunit S27-domain-containing protein [Lasiosphaeria miniovina]KAK0706555.1 mitochondrial ribosomal subunit S27-domain-containing protein [Lasiosphaeria miniovina]KAK3371388.1 mitochondrial ribosomal subunit S27-domain-containing protein [Lasiosphaeria ovina]
MAVPRARLLELMKAQCQLFSTTFNPERVRTGNKILRQRLRGPALAAYYPRKGPDLLDLQREVDDLGLLVDNDEADDRLEHIAALKLRGKSAPKKKKGPSTESKHK